MKRFAFAASTGRTATTLLAESLNHLTNVVALHEGHILAGRKTPVLPRINIHNRKAWYSTEYATEIVQKMRNQEILNAVADGTKLCIDVAYYNAPLLEPLSQQYPNSPIIVLFRRCEGFVRSATILRGEDREPAGWPDPDKELTSREQFISMGRLKPEQGLAEELEWEKWSGIKRNIWLWSKINEHLFEFSESHSDCAVLYFETLRQNPEEFWWQCLGALGLRSAGNMEACLVNSSKKINSRQQYDVGMVSSWDQEEQNLYENLALPLERKIYAQ